MASDERNVTIEIERAPRTLETRDTETRPSDSWIPQSSLPVPDPVDGITFRWVRTATLGRADNTNVSRQFREGWTPCKAEEHPELMVLSDVGSRFPGNIEIGGLLLCKMPTSRLKQRERHFQERSDLQIDGVDRNFMRDNDPRMPLLTPERSTRTSFGRDS